MSQDLIRKAIHGAFNRSRYVQQVPILPDVWIRYLDLSERAKPGRTGNNPADPRVDLLLTSDPGSEPGMIAKRLQDGLKGFGSNPALARVASNRTTVAANLTFSELISVVVPMTRWWSDLPKGFHDFSVAKQMIGSRRDQSIDSPAYVEFFTFAAIAGLLGLLLRKQKPSDIEELADALMTSAGMTPKLRPLLEEYRRLARNFEYQTAPDHAAIARVQVNRQGFLSVAQSRQTIKADACYNLFKGSAAKIRWAVVDCGIEATHPAFCPKPAKKGEFESRVVATYDFTKYRDLVSGTAASDAAGRKLKPEQKRILAARRDAGRAIDWSLVRELVTIPHTAKEYKAPKADHGTHVAGIIGANWEKDLNGKPVIGICPDIRLVDVRVFDGENTDEFNVIAALQFIAYLDRMSDTPEVHGINISFSFAHDVRNYACGRTPICVECERLVEGGVAVVAAAGNAGYSQDGADPTLLDRYANMTITDPGNAQSVITVGSTHRTQPHTYGVSYFSSRGPTGDGRAKPDVLAPGEKILSTTPGGQSGEKDGTSMAAPHVSGACAILMARSAELIGQPRTIKEILCKTATDLGRERAFQGAGVIDVLRALQSI